MMLCGSAVDDEPILINFVQCVWLCLLLCVSVYVRECLSVCVCRGMRVCVQGCVLLCLALNDTANQLVCSLGALIDKLILAVQCQRAAEREEGAGLAKGVREVKGG